MDISKNGINKHPSTSLAFARMPRAEARGASSSSSMNVPPEIGMGALRLSLGRENDIHQIDEAARLLINRVKEMRDSKAV